mmetsp:Transcript_3296/g.5144  ORF Transcript_3296/g.5144 Transcript_3296/m.5144 type:complete len:86 (-) Transcript_3296:2260-2517(-)
MIGPCSRKTTRHYAATDVMSDAAVEGAMNQLMCRRELTLKVGLKAEPFGYHYNVEEIHSGGTGGCNTLRFYCADPLLEIAAVDSR